MLNWIDLEKVHHLLKNLPKSDWVSRNPSMASSPYRYYIGDNLSGMHSLVESNSGTFSLAFVDPPYNSAHDFIVNDYPNENVAFWTHGTSHRKWLRMVYPRLWLTHQLLDPNKGIMVFCIDDKEILFSRLILDEIYGEHNFLGTIVWQSLKGVKSNAQFTFNHTYLFIYAKNKNQLKKQIGGENSPLHFPFPSIWTDLPTAIDARKELQEKIHEYIPETITRFLNPKPISVYLRLLSFLKQVAGEDEKLRILDPFAGTGSLAFALADFIQGTPYTGEYFGFQSPVPLSMFDPSYSPKNFQSSEPGIISYTNSLRTIPDVTLLRNQYENHPISFSLFNERSKEVGKSK